MGQKIVSKPALRNSNIELLRILCMVLIVCHHYAVHGGFSFEGGWSWNRSLIGLLSSGGKLGVNCFVLISGYFLCEQVEHRWKALAKLAINVCIFYGAWYFAAVLFQVDTLHLKGLLRLIAAPIRGEWWFATTYLTLMAFAPWISRGLKTMTRREHGLLIGTMVFLWSVFPTLGFAPVEGNNLTWFVLLYVLASYLRWYPDTFISKRNISGIIVCVIMAFILLRCAVIGLPSTGLVWVLHRFVGFEMDNLLMLLLSVALFCWFAGRRAFCDGKINTVAAAMFGVYLLHDCRYRWVLWESLFHNARFQDSPWLIVHAVVSIGLVFVGCTAVSMLYNRFAAPWIQKFLDAGERFIQKRLRNRI